MEKIDRELQQRVWQRVQGKSDSQPQPVRQVNVKGWILAAQENGAAYASLAKKYTGGKREQLRTMARQSHNCAACLRGICRMRGERVRVLPLPPSAGAGQSLEKCYHRERRLWQEAQSRVSDPEYGPVYRMLAEQSAQRCVLLARILGAAE